MRHKVTPKDEYHKRRLLANVVRGDNPNECWKWTACLKDTGYGRIRVNWIEYIASRLSYAVHYKRDPGSLDVCHSCDNPECTNPKHLFLADHTANIQDAVRKGRWTHKGAGVSRNRGVANGGARLTDEQVREIRRLGRKGTLMQKEIAQRFCVSRSYVSQLLSGKLRRRDPRFAPDHLREEAAILDFTTIRAAAGG